MNQASYTLIMLLTGVGIPIMASLNSRLGGELGNPLLASIILFSGGLLIAVAALFSFGSVSYTKPSVPYYYYMGGAFMAFYAISITFIAPHFGIANAVFCVLVGQIIASLAIDHFGLFGIEPISLSGLRIGGAILMVTGLILARKV